MSRVKLKLDEAFDKLYEFYGSVEPEDDQINNQRCDHIGRLLASKYRKNGYDNEIVRGNNIIRLINITGVEPISNSDVNPLKLSAVMRLTYIMSGGNPGYTNLSGHPDTYHDEPGVDPDLELTGVYIWVTPDGGSGDTFAEVEATEESWEVELPQTMRELNGNDGADVSGMVVNGKPMGGHKHNLINITGE